MFFPLVGPLHFAPPPLSHSGCLSDAIGRRPIAMFSTLCCLVGQVGQLAVVMAGDGTSVWWLMPALVAQGSGGAMGTYLAAVFAAVADISPGHVRSTNFAYAESALMLGGMVGPLLSGFLIDVDARLAFGCTALLYVGEGGGGAGERQSWSTSGTSRRVRRPKQGAIAVALQPPFLFHHRPPLDRMRTNALSQVRDLARPARSPSRDAA